MTGLWNWTWLTLAFVAELAALVALGHWGFVSGGSTAVRLLLGLGLPLLAAVLWGVFVAPQAPVRSAVLGVVVAVVVFGSAVLALLDTGHPWLAATLAVVAVLSSVLSTPPSATPPSVGGPASG